MRHILVCLMALGLVITPAVAEQGLPPRQGWATPAGPRLLVEVYRPPLVHALPAPKHQQAKPAVKPKSVWTGDGPALIRSIFTFGAETAILIVGCESGFRADAVNPVTKASGWWQWMPAWFKDGSFDPFDPVASTLKAWKVSKGGTNWGPWFASVGCWG